MNYVVTSVTLLRYLPKFPRLAHVLNMHMLKLNAIVGYDVKVPHLSEPCCVGIVRAVRCSCDMSCWMSGAKCKQSGYVSNNGGSKHLDCSQCRTIGFMSTGMVVVSVIIYGEANEANGEEREANGEQAHE